jgi:hypothetical protein
VVRDGCDVGDFAGNGLDLADGNVVGLMMEITLGRLRRGQCLQSVGYI